MAQLCHVPSKIDGVMLFCAAALSATSSTAWWAAWVALCALPLKGLLLPLRGELPPSAVD
jgi:hypothetical protein